jgi:DNA-directed RNA polymerase alpha subunit
MWPPQKSVVTMFRNAGISARAANALYNNGVETIAEANALATRHRWDAKGLNFPNFGQKSMDQLAAALSVDVEPVPKKADREAVAKAEIEKWLRGEIIAETALGKIIRAMGW